jgi:hypothetical protein
MPLEYLRRSASKKNKEKYRVAMWQRQPRTTVGEVSAGDKERIKSMKRCAWLITSGHTTQLDWLDMGHKAGHGSLSWTWTTELDMGHKAGHGSQSWTRVTETLHLFTINQITEKEPNH